MSAGYGIDLPLEDLTRIPIQAYEPKPKVSLNANGTPAVFVKRAANTGCC
jgi:hypothetical protein